MDFKKFLAHVKDMGKGSNSKLKFLLGLAAVGVILILLGSVFGGSGKRTAQTDESVQIPTVQEDKQNLRHEHAAIENEEEYLSLKLKEMLSQIRGAGNVHVTVSLRSTTISEYAINNVVSTKTTREQDQSGGTRTVTEDSENGQVVLVQSQGGQAPLVKHSSGPHISGVLVVAEGAKDPAVKSKLFSATCVALGVEPHKVLVVTKRGDGIANNY